MIAQDQGDYEEALRGEPGDKEEAGRPIGNCYIACPMALLEETLDNFKEALA